MKLFPTKRPWIYYDIYLYFFGIGYLKDFSIVILCNIFVLVLFMSSFVIKITIASYCEDPWMLTIYIIAVEFTSNYSLNEIISLGPITCFHFCTKMLYIWKVTICKNYNFWLPGPYYRKQLCYIGLQWKLLWIILFRRKCV